MLLLSAFAFTNIFTIESLHLFHPRVPQCPIITWIVLACRMARGTDQVFIHILLRAVAQISIGERDFRYFRFHW